MKLNLCQDQDESLISNNVNFESKYIDKSCVEDFINECNFFNIMHLNCRSLKKNFCEVKNLLQLTNLKISVLAVTETWLTEASMGDVNIDKYNFIGKCRNNKLIWWRCWFLHK